MLISIKLKYYDGVKIGIRVKFPKNHKKGVKSAAVRWR